VTALAVIDDQPLRDAAWQEFQALRRRLEDATRQLHQHEEVDVPAFEAWKHRTFPLHLTALRELEREVFTKAGRVQEVEARAAHTGRSVKRVWQEAQDARAASPGDRAPPADNDEEEPTSRRRQARLEDFFPEPAAKPARAAREIYRRLVQRLHPDHGGEWTPARQQLWHQVQAAWDAGDVDWLARLEIEWETAHDELGPQSPLSRLRAAVEELHAAERDLEHKFDLYQHSPAWHFTEAEGDLKDLERRVEAQLGRDYRSLRAHLRELNATIELWEEDWTRPRPRSREPRPQPAPYHEVFRRARGTRRSAAEE
jgi:ribosomal protein S21